MKSGQISWRYILWCFGELKEGDWILVDEFSNLFSVPKLLVSAHIKKLIKYSLIRKQPAVDKRSIRGGTHCRYQLSLAGRKKIEYWGKTNKGLKEVKCPRCGFCIV